VLGSWQAGGDPWSAISLLPFQLLVAVTLVGFDCASGMFRLKTKLVIKMIALPVYWIGSENLNIAIVHRPSVGRRS
jgi:hypothetical protein